HHRSRCAEARHSQGEDRGERRQVRQHLVRLDSARAGGRRRRRTARAWQAGAPHGHGCGVDVGLGTDRMDPPDDWSSSMTKTAFMFPGQGSMEAGMGREVAEAIPEAMAVFDEATAASGMDLKELCF